MKSVWNWFGFSWTVLASGYFLFAPVYASFNSDSTIDTNTALHDAAVSGQQSLVANEGTWVFVVLAIPVLVAAVPLCPAGQQHRSLIALVAITLFAAFVVLSLPSIGLFYAPAVLALAVGTYRTRDKRREAKQI